MQKSCRASSPERGDLPIPWPGSHPPPRSLRAPPPCLSSREPPNPRDLGSQGPAGGCSPGLSRVRVFQPALLEAHLQVAASQCGLHPDGRPSTPWGASTKATISCSRGEGYWKRSGRGFARWSFKALLLASPPVSKENLYCPSTRATASAIEVHVAVCLAETGIWPHRPALTHQCGDPSHDHTPLDEECETRGRAARSERSGSGLTAQHWLCSAKANCDIPVRAPPAEDAE